MIEGVLKTMAWAPQSAARNPIKFLWEELGRNVRNRCPSSQEDLWNTLQERWNNILKYTINKLMARMIKLVKIVI